MLHIYNSLKQSKELFKPIQKNKVGIYVCGMTVYDYCHIGHARVMVCFDIITRYLRECGYDVSYVRNITDIDDKIIKRAHENNESFEEITTRFIDAMHEDEQALNIIPPDHEPRATDHLPEIIQLIEKLISNEKAYLASNGDVYYAVSQFEHYGCLSHKDLDGLQAGARVGVNEEKHHPLDFVLWKSAKPNEPSWDSPWGAGRPGWHIECSAMSMKQLGEHFDIHGGGHDLIFPHHENEIAQSMGASGCDFVNTWMHVGFVQVNKEKMSKSLGNFFTIREILEKFPPEVIRYFLISSHYRSQVNFSDDNLRAAQASLEALYTSVRGLKLTSIELDAENPFVQRFNTAMDDDFNTPEAFAVLFNLSREINTLRTSDVAKATQLAGILVRMAGILGILQQAAEQFLQRGVDQEAIIKIQALINERDEAREQKNWGRADELRQELEGMGVALDDSSAGTVWRYKS